MISSSISIGKCYAKTAMTTNSTSDDSKSPLEEKATPGWLYDWLACTTGGIVVGASLGLGKGFQEGKDIFTKAKGAMTSKEAYRRGGLVGRQAMKGYALQLGALMGIYSGIDNVIRENTNLPRPLAACAGGVVAGGVVAGWRIGRTAVPMGALAGGVLSTIFGTLRTLAMDVETMIDKNRVQSEGVATSATATTRGAEREESGHAVQQTVENGAPAMHDLSKLVEHGNSAVEDAQAFAKTLPSVPNRKS